MNEKECKKTKQNPMTDIFIENNEKRVRRVFFLFSLFSIDL